MSASEDSETPDARAQARPAAGTATNPSKKENKPRRPGRGALLLALLAVLLALLAGALVLGLGYLGQRRANRLSERVGTVEQSLESNARKLRPRVRQLDRQLQSLSGKLDQSNRRIDKLSKQLRSSRDDIGELSQLVEGGRQRWLLLETEDLLATANHRLQLERDPDSARRALKLASRSLGGPDDPRLLKIRQQVSDEIAVVDALPNPDMESLTLTLTTLVKQVPKLPLASNVPSNYRAGHKARAAAGGSQSRWRRFLNSMVTALRGMFAIRRSDRVQSPLLPPDQAFFLRQNLILKLQAARLALLQRDTHAYRTDLASAKQWLQTYFSSDDPAVSGAVKQLGELSKVQVQWQPPDISASLAALRQYLRKASTKSRATDATSKGGG